MIYGYIYKIINNVNDIIYIGQTTKTLKERFIRHKSNSKYRTSYFYEEMNKIGNNNFQILLVLKIWDEDKEWLKKELKIQERLYISKCIGDNIELYNILENKNNNQLNKNIGKIHGFKKDDERSDYWKKINQYDLNDNYIKTFNSLKEAANSLNKKNIKGNISKCCKNNNKTAYGFKWKYF